VGADGSAVGVGRPSCARRMPWGSNEDGSTPVHSKVGGRKPNADMQANRYTALNCTWGSHKDSTPVHSKVGGRKPSPDMQASAYMKRQAEGACLRVHLKTARIARWVSGNQVQTCRLQLRLHENGRRRLT
jgi:hypothetical protein